MVFPNHPSAMDVENRKEWVALPGRQPTTDCHPCAPSIDTDITIMRIALKQIMRWLLPQQSSQR